MAMAHGRPIVAARVGGVLDLIQDQKNGLLCGPKDSDCLARKLLALIENLELRTRLGRAARLSYETGPFHSDPVCEAHLTAYGKTIEIVRKGSNHAHRDRHKPPEKRTERKA